MRPILYISLCACVFALGHLSCIMFLNTINSGNTDAQIKKNKVGVGSKRVHLSSSVENKVQLSTSSSPPHDVAIPLKLSNSSGIVACPPQHSPSSVNKIISTSSPLQNCKCEKQSIVGISTEIELAAYQAKMQAISVDCKDTMHEDRMGIPMISPVIARCAMFHVVNNAATLLDKRPLSIFDYGYDAMDYPILTVVSPKSFALTAFLPQDTIALPTNRGMASNQLFLSPPILFRLRALFATPNLFDVQFALRVDEILAYATPIGLLELIGRIVIMSKITFMVLPCTSSLDMTDTQLVHAAIKELLEESKNKLFGLESIEFTVRPIAVFGFRSCVKEVLMITIQKLHKRVRPKWCHYDTNGTTYNLIYEEGSPHSIAFRTSNNQVRSVISSQVSVGLADVLGWGVPRDIREVLFYDMLLSANRPNPSLHNWRVTESARISRIDDFMPSNNVGVPIGTNYIDFLRLSMCLFGSWEMNIKFREVDIVSSSDDQHSNNANTTYRKTVFESKDKSWRFTEGQLFKSGGKIKQNLGLTDMESIHCPSCGKCVQHSWLLQKFNAGDDDKITSSSSSSSTSSSSSSSSFFPPAECTECYQCARGKILKHGVPLSRAFVGCTDVHGVAENSVADRKLCDDSQISAIERRNVVAKINV